MNDPVIFVVLDAFRWDYLDEARTPFLAARASNGVHVERIITASGFTQRAAIFTGTWADTSGHWTMHCFDPHHSPFNFLAGRRWPSLVDAVSRRLPGTVGRVFDARFRGPIYRRARRRARHPSTARIPLHLLPFFSVSEDARPIQEPGALGIESVFDVFARNGISSRYLMYPEVDGTDDATEAALIDHANGTEAVYFGLLSGADQAGHAHGPDAEGTRHAVASLDARLSRIEAAFKSAGRSPRWLIVGDHGMLGIEREVDARAAIDVVARRHGLTEGRDWVGFYDSTTARIWALSDRATQFLDDAFEGLTNHGTPLDSALAQARRIPYRDRRYGDRVWLASPGVLVRPDFFHRADEVVRGMHGYDPLVSGQKGMAVVHGEGIAAAKIEEAPLVDVCAVLCDLVGVACPEKNEGRAWSAPVGAETTS